VAYKKLVVFVYLNILAFNNILKIIFLVLQFINPVIVLLDQRFECVCSQWGVFFGVWSGSELVVVWGVGSVGVGCVCVDRLWI